MITSMRSGVVAALVALPVLASAEPREIEWSGFFGVDKLPSDIGLGRGTAPEQRPQTAPMFGGRVTVLPLMSRWIALGLEGEIALTTAWTGYGFDARRSSYFAPVIGYRGDVIVRVLPGTWLEPHLVGGGGGVTVASSSPFMAKDTDGVYFWGAGVTFAVQGAWRLRIDARQVWMPSMTDDRTAAYELSLSIGKTVATRASVVAVVAHHEVAPPPPPPIEVAPPPPPLVEVAPPPPPPVEVAPPPPVEVAPPPQVEVAPPPPPPPVPAKILAAFETATAVRFEPDKARITPAGKLSLAKVLDVLRDNPQLKITITGHDDDGDLAKKRAEAVKWYLVDQGVAEDQIETATAAADAHAITIAVR
jgi:outer membrane protein OmpA-like peptidoglycan-associated protein